MPGIRLISNTPIIGQLPPADQHDLAGALNLINMSLELFQIVPTGAIETLFDDQNQPLLKRSNLGKYLGIRNIRDNFKEFSSHHSCPKSEIGGAGVTDPRGRTKNSHDILLNLDKAIEILFALKNPRQLP